MIKLSNGHAFSYIAASGALAYDGSGWPWEHPLRWMGLVDPRFFTVVTKTLTYLPRKGNLRWYAPWRCVRLLKEGVVNAIGLTNPGFRWWCGRIGPRIDRSKIPIIVSIRSENCDELAEMAHALSTYDIVGLEFNASCPNSEKEKMASPAFIREACARIKEAAPQVPLGIKLGLIPTVPELVKAAEPFVEFFQINSVPWGELFPERISPLRRYGGGGVSGKVAQGATWQLYDKISALTATPVVAPSVWTIDDLTVLDTKGAQAVSFGSVFLRHPTRPTQIVRTLRARKEPLLCNVVQAR